MPPLAGFFGKFLIFDAAIQRHQFTLVVVGVLTVACGFYYYLKVVAAMYWQAPVRNEAIPISWSSRAAMSILVAAIIGLGVYPQPILSALEAKHGHVVLTSTLSH